MLRPVCGVAVRSIVAANVDAQPVQKLLRCAGAGRRVLHLRALTLADRKRDTLDRLYRHGNRVAPWAGTAHGVHQGAWAST